jgi:hypothetical protein
VAVRFRRRRQDAPTDEPSTALVISPRVERALITIAVHAQQLDDRIVRLERRIDGVIEDAAEAPTHEDLLEVRMHSAKVAAELTRVTVALRAEIDEAGRHEPSPDEQRLLHFAEQVRQLSDRLSA